MRALICILLLPTLASCKPVDCGPGTIEKNGTCVPADELVETATCGPNTMLEGGQCVPTFQPTQCDEATTVGELDLSTGVITCIGTAAGFACPQPDADKMTICGQVYDLETGMPFSDNPAMCTECPQPGAGTGVCSIGLRAVDAVAFATNPMDPNAALAPEAIFLDDCGRYRLENIPLPAGPLVGIGVDDAMQGPGGTTNSTAVSTPKVAGLALKDFETFIAKKSTTDAWAASGGPPISGGIFVGIFRAMSTGLANQPGVTILRNGTPIANDDFYFLSTDAVRTTVDPSATSTGANGTVLVTNAQLGQGYTAAPGAPLPAECAWSAHAGVSLPFILLVQVFRPVDGSGTCPL